MTVSTRWILITMTFLLLAGPVYAIDPPHEPDCANCHSIHGSSYPGMLGKLCQGCHFEGGPAPSVQTHSSRTTGTGYGNWDLDCWACHDAHEHQQNWVYGTSYGKYLRTEQRAQVKEIDPADPGPYYEPESTLRWVYSSNICLTDNTEYVDGDINTDDDLCQNCHVNTSNYNPALSANYHSDQGYDSQPGGNCLSCHPHDNGFAPSGGGSCLGCHASEKGASSERRQVTGTGGDYERPSHHVSDGSTTEIVTDADCVVCHDQSSHQGMADPNVLLNSPDGGPAVIYDGTGESIEAWCNECHDADGSTAYDADGFAGNGIQPFSDGQVPFDMAQYWDTPSAHAITPVSDLATNRCMSCHGGVDSTSAFEGNAHGSAQNDIHSDFVEGEPVDNDEESLCFSCHDADGGASTDIESRYSLTGSSGTVYHHPIDDAEQVPGREVECNSCHNHHAATADNPLADTLGVDIEGLPVGPGTANPRQALEYEVCLLCHGDTYNATMYRTTNKRLDIYPSNSAFHPVAAVGRNQSTAMQNQLLGGMTTSSIIKCIDCHNNEATADVLGSADNSTASPKGTHGSNIGWNLRAEYLEDPDPGSIGGWNADNYRLCLLCHDEDGFMGADGNGKTNFNSPSGQGGSGQNLHRVHLEDNTNIGVPCATCHYNNHGSQDAAHTVYEINGTILDPPNGYKTRLVSFSPEVTARSSAYPIFRIDTNTRKRSCDIKCHGRNHPLKTYLPDSAGDDDSLTYPYP